MSTLTVYGYEQSVGSVILTGSKIVWADIRAGAGSSTLNYIQGDLLSDSKTGTYYRLTRGVTSFNTSALTAGATITAATISYFGNNKANALGDPTANVTVISPAPDSATSYVAGDYDHINDTVLMDTAFDYATWSKTGYNTGTLNSSGRSAINKTGYTCLMFRLGWDISNSPAYVKSVASNLVAYPTNYAGTDHDPYLYITYSTGTTTPKSLSATSAGNATLAKKNIWARSLSITEVATVSLSRVKSFYRTLSSTSTTIPTISRVRTAYKTISAALAGSAVLTKIRTVPKTLAVQSVGTATLEQMRTFYRTIAATSPAEAVIAKALFYYRTISVINVTTATVTPKSTFARLISVTGTATVVISRTVTYYRTISAAGTISTILDAVKQTGSATYYQALSVIESATVGLSGVSTRYKALSVTAASQVRILKKMYVLLSATGSGIIDLAVSRTVAMVLIVAENTTVTLSRVATYCRSLAATGPATTSLSRAATYYRALTATGIVVTIIQAIWRAVAWIYGIGAGTPTIIDSAGPAVIRAMASAPSYIDYVGAAATSDGTGLAILCDAAGIPTIRMLS